MRACNGQVSRRYQGALRQWRGRISATGMTRDVNFDPVMSPTMTAWTMLTVPTTAPALISLQ
ncbi:hypothetical protein [Caballeronia novacaledonica]|uniref:hypothetical protein n=1 Tax=Caballeronia novacaledonica TaxID=1544861 RepID=UPI003857A345